MDTFASLFDEASRDIEAEGRDRIVTSATQAATSQCWGFLSLAQSENEFGHRLALVEDRLTAIASEHGLSYEEVAAPLRNGFEAVLAAKEAGADPKAPDLASEAAAAGARCANCGHMNPTHRKGGLCECGCDSYQPDSRTAAIRAPEEYRRGASYDPNSLNDLDLHNPGYHRAYEYTEGYDHAYQGQQRKPGGYGSRDKTMAYEHGYQHGLKDIGKQAAKTAGAWDNVSDGPLTEKASPSDKEQSPSSGPHMPGMPKLPGMGGGAAAGEAGAAAGAGEAAGAAGAAGGLAELAPLLLLATRFDNRVALMRTALEEGQDPLSWLPQDAASPAYAERPGGHMTTQVFEGTETSAYDEALAQGGGSAQPENAGGHSTAPVTSSRGDRPFA